MRNRRLLLILIGAVVIVGSFAIGIVLYNRARPTTEPGETGVATPQPALTYVVVSAQNIARGQRITEDAVYLQNWPTDAVPVGALTALSQAHNQIARVDIARGTPVVESMLTTQAGEVIGVGSEASMQIPEDRVAYAFPISRYTGVAWALRPGDRVDVLVSMLLVNLDEEFQTILPNSAACLTLEEGETCQSGLLGRTEILPNGMVVNVIPSEPQRPRLVTQMTVQDALVLRVGDWPMPDTAVPGQQTTTGTEGSAAQPAATEGQEGEAAPPLPTVLSVTIAVTPQEAAVLEYALLSNARVTLVLRSAASDGIANTSSVTLQYLMNQYGIETPPLLPYGITPPVTGFPSPE